MNTKSIIQLLGFIIISECAGVVGSLFTAPSIPTWYVTLNTPSLNPPSWVFAPVWTTLFVLMGVGAFLVWQKKPHTSSVRMALLAFSIQLFLNTLWSVLFFGLHNPFLAFLEIILLWLAIAWTLIAFWRVSHVAAYLLVPYLAWVTFAGYLNFSIWQLNKHPAPVFCTMEAKICPDGSAVGRTGPQCEFAPCPTEKNP